AATDGGDDLTVAGLSGNPAGLPAAAPVGGVITRWTVNSALAIPPEAGYVYGQKLLVLRPLAPTAFQLVGESSFGTILGAVNTFPTRIPVQAGDRLGLGGTFATLYCETGNPADVMAYDEGTGSPGPVPGGVLTLPDTAAGYQVPAAATIEPDVDGDGYGDESQDGCPQSAAYQTPCPVVVLDAYSQVGGQAVTVKVATSLASSVTVSGTVKLGKGASAKLSAKAKVVNPGKLGKFTLQFPAALKEKLKEMEPGQKLSLKITAKATNLAGAASTDKLSVKLKGQG
ncbi:MAG TPA: hypothetical protein VFB52_04125, partial [Solirubrobacterales bacterium]|nr:hypothetical protein [Solirubrobacterales bacterium]